MKNTPRLYLSEGKTPKCYIEAWPEVDNNTTRSAHESLSGANKRATTPVHMIGALWAKTELEKKGKREIKMELVNQVQLEKFKHVHCAHTNAWTGW